MRQCADGWELFDGEANCLWCGGKAPKHAAA